MDWTGLLHDVTLGLAFFFAGASLRDLLARGRDAWL